MHFTDEQAVDVKAWIVKKLEDMSANLLSLAIVVFVDVPLTVKILQI